jgi:hypothetical protein
MGVAMGGGSTKANPHRIEGWCTAFAIMLHGLLPAPNDGSRASRSS